MFLMPVEVIIPAPINCSSPKRWTAIQKCGDIGRHALRTYLFPAAVGVHMFYDLGRVWYKDSTGIDPSANGGVGGVSDVWHKSYGGGIWMTPYSFATVVTEIGHSTEGTLFYLRLGFLF